MNTLIFLLYFLGQVDPAPHLGASGRSWHEEPDTS